MDSLAALSASSPILSALLAAMAGGFIATTVGALPVLLVARLSERTSNSMLAFAAGVMLAATVFSLLLPMGVGAASGDAQIGLAVTLAIGLQNLPEGLAVAMALAGLGYTPLQALGVAALTGLVEVVGGLVGAGLLSISQALLPMALAFAGGTMLFVISDEVIPETHRAGFGDSATAALFVGFGLMFFLDVALG